jgi:hypothetical protein
LEVIRPRLDDLHHPVKIDVYVCHGWRSINKKSPFSIIEMEDSLQCGAFTMRAYTILILSLVGRVWSRLGYLVGVEFGKFQFKG